LRHILRKIKNYILRSLLSKKIIAFLDSKPFPGNKEVSWYAVTEFFLRWVDTRDIGIRTSALSYTFMLALFPSVIFIFTLIAYLPFGNNANEIIAFLATVIPKNTFNAIKLTLIDILENQRGGLLSLGFFTAMYFSTNGFVKLMKMLDRYDPAKRKRRSFWKTRIVALILSVIVSISLFLSVLFLTLGSYAINVLNEFKYFPSAFTPGLLMLFNYLIVVLIVLFIVSAIYFLAPSATNKWRFFSPGSIFASAVIVITTIIFSAYVNQFNTYNKVYGSIGALIVVMLLIYINTYILLLGHELNVAIDKTIEQIKSGKAIKANRIYMLKEEALKSNETTRR
jgi:membrane protein